MMSIQRPPPLPFLSIERACAENFDEVVRVLNISLSLSSIHDKESVSLSAMRVLLHHEDVETRKTVVDVRSVEAQTDTLQQVLGSSIVSFAVIVTALVAETKHGLTFGTVRESVCGHFWRVTLANHCSVLCRAAQEEHICVGEVVFVVVEPNCVKCVSVRPPRVAKGRWKRFRSGDGEIVMTQEDNVA
jgi:hypothetical protein